VSIRFSDVDNDSGVFRAMLEKTIDSLLEYMESHTFDVCVNEPPCIDASRQFVESNIPKEGTPLDTVLDTFFYQLLPQGINTASKGYMAYIPGGGLLTSALADLIVASTNRYVGIPQMTPNLVQIESNVIKWFAKAVGYGLDAKGIFTSGGSMANLSAIVCAREACASRQLEKARVYCSSETHHSIQKSLLAAGLYPECWRIINSGHDQTIDLDKLEQAIIEDKREGLKPFLIIANAGTTSSGAIDPLNALANIAQNENLWLHTDAAYGGMFVFTERGKTLLKGIERSDSVTMDPHKGMFLPYGTGLLLVKNGYDLAKPFAISHDYLPEGNQDDDIWNFQDLSLELSRRFRGLGPWLAFKCFGRNQFEACLDEKLTLCEDLKRRVCKLANVEILQANLSLFAFRYVDESKTPSELNNINRQWLDNINRGGEVFISGTIIEVLPKQKSYYLRVCILSYRTHQETVDCLWQKISDSLP